MIMLPNFNRDYTLSEINSSHLKIDGIDGKGRLSRFPFEGSFLAGAFAVHFRKGNSADDFSS